MKVFRFMFIFICLFTVAPISSYACSCAEPDSVKTELDRNTAVFSGKVVETLDKNANMPMKSSADLIAVKFLVKETWKGVNQTEVIVYTERDSASCGFEFSVDQEYLVYATGDGKLRVSLCSRTAPLHAAKADLQELGKGKKPTEKVTVHLGSTNEFSDRKPLFIFGFIIPIGVFIAVVWIARRNKV